MNRFTFGALAAATAIFLPLAAQAQQLPAAVIGVVDTDSIFRTCTACAAANTALQGQVQQLQQRATALRTPLQAEEQALTQVVGALPQGQNPDAALSARIQAFQTNQQNAQRELAASQERIERNVNFVRQQIGQRIQPAIQQVMQQRGATLVVDRAAALSFAPTIDLTAPVLAIVNQNTTPLNLNAPAPQQPAAQPPAQPQQQPRRPQGR
jgi:outer membrane protein